MSAYRRVYESELFRFTQEVFQAVGVPCENAAIVADNLVQGELHGLPSHGVSRLLATCAERFRAGGTNGAPQLRVVSQHRGCALVDGDNGPGAVVGRYAMRLALELAAEHGSGWVGVRNSSHYGAAFIFAREALPLGMIGVSTTSAVAQMAPFGGRDKLLGTNPLCFAVPGGERGDVILDMATSVVARGKVQMAILEGKEIPLGWAVDAAGHPTTDPNKAARMLPVGGYKGYGLALIVEILSVVLTGAAFSAHTGNLFDNPSGGQNIGHFFGALDVSAFLPLEAFRARLDELIALIKAVPLEEGCEEILLPGEPEARTASLYRVAGIPLAEDVVETMTRLSSDLGVTPLELLE